MGMMRRVVGGGGGDTLVCKTTDQLFIYFRKEGQKMSTLDPTILHVKMRTAGFSKLFEWTIVFALISNDGINEYIQC